MNHHNYFIYSNFDFSYKSAAATRMRYYAKALADNNHNVFLISCCSNKFNDENFVEIEPNIFVLEKKKIATNIYHTLSFLRRLDAFSNSKEGRKSFLFYPSQVVPLQLLGLFYLKIYKRHPVYYELNEIRKFTALFEAPISFKRIVYSLKKITYKTVFTIIEPLLFFYSGLVCISTAIEEYGRRFNKNTVRIPILTDPDIILEKSTNIYFKKGSFNIGFAGTIDPTKENLEDFVETLAKARRKGHKISFNLCGTISEKIYNSFFLGNEVKGQMKYYGSLNEKELSTFLSQQDLLVIPRGNCRQNKYGFSTKLSDYLNHQKTILVTDISDNKLFIKDGINGFLVPPDNVELMSKKLEYIIQNFDELKNTIIPNAKLTSREKFHYILYREPLRNFLK